MREALLGALKDDPYFEVRAMAAKALGESMAPCDELERELIAALDDSYPEVVIEVIGALGTVARGPDIIAQLQRFYLHDSWQVRRQVVAVLYRLLERRVVVMEDVKEGAEQILATSPFFAPQFPLKQQLNALAHLIGKTSTEQQNERQLAEKQAT